MKLWLKQWQATSHKQGITKIQRDAYKEFVKSKARLLNSAFDSLFTYFADELFIDIDKKGLEKRLKPTMLLLSRDGETALFFEDLKHKEEGLVVILLPESKKAVISERCILSLLSRVAKRNTAQTLSPSEGKRTVANCPNITSKTRTRQ